jgi:rfaE bifunctional protein nucleotidyltransferase chain/domain
MSRISYVKSKIVSLDEAILKVNAWKMKQDKIVFTNGCFDILHLGHVSYLAQAADLGSKLIVALNTDASVKKLGKGEDRPINKEQERMQIIASLAFVDLVILFTEETPLETIQALLPDVLVKGADYDPTISDKQNKKYIVGSDLVLANSGIVKVIDLEDGFSTTKLIEKIKS